MSQKHIQGRVDNETEQRIEQVREDLDLDTTSEAIRRIMDEGLRRLGYAPGEYRPVTPLRQALQKLAMGFGLAGVLLVGITLTWTIEARVMALMTCLVGMGCWVADRGLSRVEPSVSDRLPSIGGD